MYKVGHSSNERDSKLEISNAKLHFVELYPGQKSWSNINLQILLKLIHVKIEGLFVLQSIQKAWEAIKPRWTQKGNSFNIGLSFNGHCICWLPLVQCNNISYFSLLLFTSHHFNLVRNYKEVVKTMSHHYSYITKWGIQIISTKERKKVSGLLVIRSKTNTSQWIDNQLWGHSRSR